MNDSILDKSRSTATEIIGRIKCIAALKTVTRWLEDELHGHPHREFTYRQNMLDLCKSAIREATTQ